jgi:hypothetical protein
MGQKVVQVLSSFTEDILNELLLLAFAEAQHKLLEVATEDVIEVISSLNKLEQTVEQHELASIFILVDDCYLGSVN